MAKYDLRSIMSRFDVEGRFESAVPYGNGHINDTFLVVMSGRKAKRHILQRVNHHVFKRPDLLMENVRRVTVHLREKVLEAGRDPERNALSLFPTREGEFRLVDEDGNTWRLYRFIEETVGYDIVESSPRAHEGGRAFGEFQRMLTDLPGPPLDETIPRFHDVELRVSAFEEAVKADRAARANDVGPEIEWVRSRVWEMGRFIRLGRDGALVVRTTHNDTKFNNVLLDARTDEAVCVIDLDTVMPGFVLYDFGDSVRTVTNTALEDEADGSKIRIDLDLFRAYTQGYLSQAAEFLTPVEVGNLAFAGLVMTFTIGIRFFTDYLDGDRYFKIRSPDHNLIRARAQFTLLESMERGYEEMERIVAREYARVKEHSR